MVTEFGMSEGFGPLSLEGPGGSDSFLVHRSYSEDTAQRVDAEVRRLVEESYDRARTILGQHESVLRTLAAELRVREVMEGPEIAGRLEELGVTVEGKGPELPNPGRLELPDPGRPGPASPSPS